MRRTDDAAPERGGGASAASGRRAVELAIAGISNPAIGGATRTARSRVEACAGGLTESLRCTWQQDASGPIVGPQFCIISLQQACCSAGAKQASAGVAAQRANTSSNKNAPAFRMITV